MKRKFGETKLHKLFNKIFVFTMIKFMNSFNLKIADLEYPTECCKFDSFGSHLTVAGHVINVFFCYQEST